MATGDGYERERHVTLTDVARAAGVSVATASKAINGRFDVNEATRRRVMLIAEGMMFSPNALARGLLAGKTHTVGIVTNDLDGRFAPQVMYGAENALDEEQSVVLLSNSAGEPAREDRQIRALLERRVDGLIIVHDDIGFRPPARYVGGTRTVYAFAASSDASDTSIVPDTAAGARLGTEHLLSLGRRSIAHIGGPSGSVAAADRAIGVREALASFGLPLAPERILTGPWHDRWGWEAMASLLDRGVSVDGVVAGDDRIARGAIELLQSRSIRVPEDVAVVGNDNWGVLVRLGHPQISSVDLNLREIGAAAVRELYGENPMQPGVTRVSPELNVRGSSVAGVQPEDPWPLWPFSTSA